MSEARDAMRAACIERAGRALAVAHERIIAERAEVTEREAEQLPTAA